MTEQGKRSLWWGLALLLAFGLMTAAVLWVDVQPAGVNSTNIGFATLNGWFHQLTGVHMALYTVTDWLGLVPIAVCMVFGAVGLVQWIRRRRIARVDRDILLLGAYYVLVIGAYLVFEMIPINYRPVLIDGAMEASYPSSTTLLVLSVMPTLWFQAGRRVKNSGALWAIRVFAAAFSIFMVAGRTVAGVHWLTDIVASVLLSAGLYLLYRGAVLRTETT